MTLPLVFGAPGDAWVYYPDKKLYDLTRDGPAPSFSFETTQGRPGTTVNIQPEITALVVVDMQNFFLDQRCNNHPDGLKAAERIVEVVAKCRKLGIKIIWLNWGLTESDLLTMPPAAHRSFSSQLIDSANKNGEVQDNKGQTRAGFGSDMGSGRGKLLMAGSWNAELYEPLLEASDQENDIFCSKNRISGLWTNETPLHKAVKESFRTLIFAGVNTDQCVLGTLFDAYNRGFDCLMLEDCCATNTPGGKEVTARNVSECYGFVTDSRGFCSGREQEDNGRQTPQNESVEAKYERM
ncbi:putative isochorismatase hydrolase [Rosellinia necatrix]|uniref:Putative isochorismatase hydrolase n=1 Tax=Rosellinia necatrix TaxID=77044 RepID=A0A1S8A6E3_ROSNE|nr:putative isochorismatase hydrolase [Rosellinia necatrix]